MSWARSNPSPRSWRAPIRTGRRFFWATQPCSRCRTSWSTRSLALTSGLPAGFATLQDIGIKLNDDNTLKLDAAALTAALQKDPESVARMFTQSAVATNAAVTFVSAGTSVRTGAAFAVQVTTAAERAQVRGAGAADAMAPDTETLSFGGTLFGAGGKTITLAAGNTLAQTIAQINNSAALGRLVTAYEDNGALGLRSVGYGTAQNFTVASNRASGYSGSGTGRSARPGWTSPARSTARPPSAWARP
jgi:flagellar hook-associated protein 2